MPIKVPSLDDRTWRAFRDEAISRIPAHTPEWTHHGEGDPGVALLELFAFMAESVAYRASLIPERNRLKFLSLLGVPLHPGAPARGLVQLSLEGALPATTQPGDPAGGVTLGAGTSLRAGAVAFGLDRGLTVLPIEGRAMVKLRAQVDDATMRAWYDDYYRASTLLADAEAELYQTTPLESEVSLADTVDNAVWIALLARADDSVAAARNAIAGRVISLGLAPVPRRDGLDVPPTGVQDRDVGVQIEVWCPRPDAASHDFPQGWTLLATGGADLRQPAVLQLALPAASELRGFQDLEPTDPGVGDLPPDLGDEDLEARLITWLRLQPTLTTDLRVRWVGINAAPITQGEVVSGERLEDGAGLPDEERALASLPVVEGSLALLVDGELWSPTSELASAPREGLPGSRVYRLDCESGALTFGDGLRGARPKGEMLASYRVSAGAAGNVAAGAINQLGGGSPGGVSLRVSNPIATWGGTSAERVEDGEKQIARTLQHRDRLVTAQDFEDLARRTPGVDLARVEVLPAWHPDLGDSDPGDAPGCVTLLLIPTAAPDSRVPPDPDDGTLLGVARWLEPRRLITTELALRGPTWVPLDLRLGVDLGGSTGGAAEIQAAVRAAVLAHLSPVPCEGNDTGWPLRRPVRAAELAVVVARVPGVTGVSGVTLARAGSRAAVSELSLGGLELPWVATLSVGLGEPAALDAPTAPAATRRLPVPLIPDECR